MQSLSPSSVLIRLWMAALTIQIGMKVIPASAQDASRAIPAEAGAKASAKVFIVNASDKLFDSIQSAIDAAQEGDSIQIGEGRFDERLRVNKQITLHGAGADKTVLGPTLDNQIRLREKIEEFAERVQSGKLTDEERLEPAKLQQTFERQFRTYSSPVIDIKNAVGVELRGLKVTLPDTPKKGTGLNSSNAIAIDHADVRIHECAVVGCMETGVHASNGANLTIQDSLIAGAWGTGVAMFNREPGRLRISDSEIRNCYHNNIWTGPYSDPCIIERCRISGSAWFGIRYGEKAPVIEHNLIFENARSGIYAEGPGGTIRGNLFLRNENGGTSCYYDNKAKISDNVFIENGRVSIWVNGDGEPLIAHNVFLKSERGISYEPLLVGKKTVEPTGKYHVRDNLFWGVEKSVVLRDAMTTDGQWTDRAIAELDTTNQILDPRLTIMSDVPLQVEESSPIRQFGLEKELDRIPMRSRWPITDEEKAMIPDEPTRDWSKWKMRP